MKTDGALPSEMTLPQKIKLSVAGYELHSIPTGIFALDGGAMFGTVPKVLWQKTNPADNQNRIQMEARALLLKSPNHCILIDTGNGSDFVAKYGEKLGKQFADIYAVEQNGPSLLKSLAHHGLQPEDIHDVILTHLHFDHAGGATTQKNNQLVPTFPKARYHLQRKNLETAENPNRRERASYFKANFEPLLKNEVLQLIDGDTSNRWPGVSLMVSNGHTQAHQVVHIHDDSHHLFYCGDVIPTSTHVRLAWGMGYDLNPLLLMEEKNNILKQAVQKKAYLFFEHDPYCDLALVDPHHQDYHVKERFRLD